MDSGVIAITGVMAAGKSTVAQLVAERLARSAHVHGNDFNLYVVGGRARMDRRPDGSVSSEAWNQLRLRYRLAALVADEYARAGFTAVVQDVVTGPLLSEYVGLFSVRPLHLVVLDPDAAAVARRERDRPKTGYTTWTVEECVADHRRDTERIGLWIDSSEQTPAETADELVDRLDEARIA
ncbi:MAG TPA: AAA family ATPase [Nocardioidaceae bacterium]|nr:AAA family ATPase [Nocardioidaceae bacterium]